MGEAVRKFSLETEVKPHQVFCPISYWEWRNILEPEAGSLNDKNTYAIHLWNEKWRASGQDKNARYHEACLYEQLKSKYL